MRHLGLALACLSTSVLLHGASGAQEGGLLGLYALPECPAGANCGISDYKDKTYACDETTTPLKPGQADIVEFRCLDGRCMSIEGLRNGYKNCEDGSDEGVPEALAASAPTPPPPTPAPTTPAPATTTEATTTTEETTTTLPETHTTTSTTLAPTTTTTAAPTTTPTTPPPPPPPPPSPLQPLPPPPTLAATTTATATATATTTATTTMTAPLGPAIRTVQMTDPSSGSVWYTGPVDEDGRAHGTGKFDYSDGNKFVGIFDHGVMQAGVLYSSKADEQEEERRSSSRRGREQQKESLQARLTMRSGGWTTPSAATLGTAVDPAIVRAFPLEQAFNGPLRVTIKSASNLDNTDWLDKDDPFAKAEFSGDLDGAARLQFTTPQVQNTLNPVWDYSFELPHVEIGDKMWLKVKDRDSWGSDDGLGSTTLFFTKVPKQETLPLKGHESGMLEVSVVAASDAEVEAPIGVDCGQYVVGSQEASTDFLARGSLRSGIQYSASKSFSDKVQAASALAAWGTVVNGVEAGGNWVQVCRPATADGTAQQQPWYLPKVGPNGETLLVPFLAQASIDLDEEQDEDDGGLPKAIEGPEKPMDTTTTHTTTPSTTPSTTASTPIVTAPQTTAAKTKTSAEATTAESKRERRGYNLNFHGWGSDTHADTVILTTTTTQEATTTTSTELLMMPFQETSTTETTTQKRTPGTAVPVTTQAPSTTTTKQLKTFNPPELNKLKSESDDDLGGGDEDSDHAEVGVHVEDKVIVLSSFSGNRSCSSRMSKQALSHRDVRQMCRDASVEIASGTSGVVLATGPRNSVVIRFASNPLPQLVMEEQLTVLAIECVHNYCSQGAVVVTSTFSTDQGVQLLEGQTATVLQSSTKSLVISVPTVEHTQTVAASKFSHISCRQDEHSCSGSALVVTKDFTLDSGLELIKGQWGTFLRMDSKSNAVINFSSGLKEQLVPKHYLRFLGCLAEAVAPEPPKLEPNVFPAPRWITGSMGSLKPRRGSGRRLNEELAEVQDRELRLRSRGKGHNASDKSSIASHFRRQSAPRARAWRAPAQSADPCVPQELTRYPSTSLAVAFSVVIEHLSVKQSDKRQLQADIEMKLKNTSGLSEVKLELRYGGDSEASVALGFITPAKDDDDADVFQSCDKLRKNAQAVLLEAISKRMPNKTASGLRVEGGYFSTQHSWLTHRPDPEAVHTSLCFSAELVDFEKARLKREKEIQQAFFKGILLATGRSTVASNLKVVWHLPPSDQTTSQGRRLASDNDKVTADVCIAVSRMDKANKLWHYLLASGAQYLQVVLQPLIGLGTQVFLGAFVVTYQAMPPATDSWDTNVIEKSGLILALNGLTTWRVIVISDTDTFDRLQAQNEAIKNKTETTKKALQIQQEEDELTWEQRRAICLWEKHFDEWYKEQPLQIAPYPVVDYPPQPGLPEIPELLPEDAVPWPPFPSNPPWPLLVENYPEVVDEREEARLAQAAHNHNHATAANTLQEARASWQRQPIDIFNLTETLGCSARDVTYEPLDMTGAGPTKEVTIAACQARCSLTSGCARFAYWLAGGICHLQNAFAYRTGARFGFISGPSGCRLNQQSLEIIQIQLKKRTCFDIDTSRTPLDMTGTTPRRADNILECQDRCQCTLGCWYFTFNSLSNMCHLSDYHAQPVAHMEYHVAGPSECQPPAQFSFRIVNLPYDCVADKVWLMTKLELAIRKAVACEAGYNVTMNSVGAVLRPLRLTRTAGSSMPARAASSRTSVQVVIWPPNHMTFEELDAQMNDTAKLTMALNAAIRFVPGIKCCKRGFVILVEDVTPLKSMQDVTASRNQARNRAVAAGEAAKEATIRQKEAKEQQMDPGHIAAKDARKEAAILEMVDAKQEKRDREIEVARQKAARNAAMKEAMQQSPCQSGHCLPGVVNGAGPGTLQREEEKRGDFFRRTSMPVGGAVFVMSLLACAVVAFVGASGGMAVSRSMARRQRQRRLEQAGLIEASGDRFSSLLRTERPETSEAMAGIEEYSDSDDDNFAEDATARQALVSSHSRGFSAARRTQPSNASGFRLHLPMPSGDTEDPPAWPPEMRAQLAGIGSLLSCAVGSPQTERGLAREVTSLPSSAAAPFMLDADFDLSRLGGDVDPLSD